MSTGDWYENKTRIGQVDFGFDFDFGIDALPLMDSVLSPGNCHPRPLTPVKITLTYLYSCSKIKIINKFNTTVKNNFNSTIRIKINSQASQ